MAAEYALNCSLPSVNIMWSKPILRQKKKLNKRQEVKLYPITIQIIKIQLQVSTKTPKFS